MMQQNSNKTATIPNFSSFYIVTEQIPKKTFRPYILSEDRLAMLKRYRSYVNNYNRLIKEKNKEIVAYNKQVREFVATNNLEQQAKIAQSNFDNKGQQNSKTIWLSIEAYNNLVESHNENLLLLPKRKHSKVQANQERTFEVILWQFGNQLSELRNNLASVHTSLPVSFPKVSTTSTSIANLTHDGEQRILYTKRTVQNHLYRLRDAGVIIDYSYHGSKKPVNFVINPAIFQMHDKKNIESENQSFTYFSMKNFHNKSEDTRTITKERIKKIGNVDNHSQKEEVASFADGKNRNSYKITKKDDVLKTSNQHAGKLAARENLSENKLSEYLRSQILYRSEFLQGLTEQQYVNYSYSACQMQRRLETEVTKGILSREEYRELLLQLFLKITAPIWKGMNVYYGSWHNAYEKIDDEYLRNPNGSIPRKETLLYQFGLLVYRISRAKRFFKKKKDYCIHYPCIYFDPTRKQPKEGGFAYTLEWLKKYQKYQDDRKARQQQRATKAGNRRRQMTAEEKVRSKIKLYINGKLSLPQVFAYIEHNRGIPNYFVLEVPRLIEIVANKEFDLYE